MDFYAGSLLLTSLASLALGAFVYLRGKDKIPNITLGLFAATLALWCFGQLMGEILTHRGLILFWTRVGIAGAVFIPVFFLHFILSFLSKTSEKKRTIQFIYALGILFLLLDFTPLFVADVGPVPGFAYYPKPGPVYPFFAIFVLACFIYGFVHLFLACRHSMGSKRNQLLYVILASLIGFAGGITAFFPVWGIDFPILSHFALPLYVLITIYAILKHRLLDISVIVREGLIYSTLTVLFAGFYALIAFIANYRFSGLISFPPALAEGLVVFVSVLVFQPVRDKVQRGVDQLFFKGEFRFQKTIDDLSAENQKLFRGLLRADKLAALGTLSAGLAHEIKNPLASIKGLTQVLEENLNDPEFVKKYQEIVPRQIDRINKLVEKLLKFGQPRELSLHEFDLSQVVEEVLSLLENQCHKKNITVEKSLDNLPKIMGDPELISQVFMNLILNAIQAMPNGGNLSIKSNTPSLTYVCVEVSDTGAGIPGGKLDKIFDPFFSSKEKGAGMGLAVAYRIVKEHGGEINVESEIGKGTEFRIWLPIKLKPSV
jgi:signal transduction histidine kinase